MRGFVFLLRGAVWRGNPVAAWNLAVYYRRYGGERQYRHWIRIAALMGDREASEFLNGKEHELRFRPLG